MRLKDGFIHPILIALCAEEGRQPPPSLQLLPTELKLLCLRHLQVCSSLRCSQYSALRATNCNIALMLKFCYGTRSCEDTSVVNTLEVQNCCKVPCRRKQS